jgi:pyruvate/2-oxoglutarate dehydrogenase complex dihydrolipoamide acyltransferase (E2) component
MGFLGFKRNVDLGPPLRLSAWRKVAVGTWRTAGDPSVYGVMELDMARALAYVDRLRAETGLKITLTHFMGRVMAEVLRRHPEINCILRFGRLYPRKTVDVFFQVASDSAGEDLSGTTIRAADTKTVAEIAREMQERVQAIREKGDPAFMKTKKLMGATPGFLTGLALTFTGWILYTLNLWTPLLGSPRDPFGSIMITSIGSLGLDMAFAPLVPYSRVPILIAIGAVRETPVARDGKVQTAQICKIACTFDHRLIDGVHGSRMARSLAAIVADPEKELGKG